MDKYDSIVSDDCDQTQNINDIKDKYMVTMGYLGYLIQGDNLKPKEKLLRNTFIQQTGNGIKKNPIDVLQKVCMSHIEFKEYCRLYRNTGMKLSPSLFELVDKKYIAYYLSSKQLLEL